MTQFKETAAYEDLQRMIGNEIAGVYLARLKEFGVPDDRLRQVSEDICYDIASVMNTVGDFEMPEVDQSHVLSEKTDEFELPESNMNAMELLEEKTDELDLTEEPTDDMVLQEERTDELELLEESTDKMAFQEERTDELGLMSTDSDEPRLHKVEGVLSQNEILKILDAAKSASV